MGRIGHFLKEARRRRVFRIAALYIVATWVILQVADVLLPAWNIPEAAKQFVLIGAVIGFPLALILGWIYDVTSEGLVHTKSISDTTGDADLSPRASGRGALSCRVRLSKRRTHAPARSASTSRPRRGPR